LIDLHIHILPGFDDGAGDLEEALTMARRACDDGISAVVATPHVITGLYSPSKEKILAAVGRFNDILHDNGIPLDILPGSEYRLEPDLPERATRGELLTLNDTGRYLLVELPAAFFPSYTKRVVYELLLRGIVPVIAHPERNAAFIKDPSLLHDLVARGALVQVTAGSVTGLFGSSAAGAAKVFLEHGCAHFIASDAHSSRGRVPVLSPAVREVEKILGEERARDVIHLNQQLAVKGENVPVSGLVDIKPARRGLLSRLLSK